MIRICFLFLTVQTETPESDRKSARSIATSGKGKRGTYSLDSLICEQSLCVSSTQTVLLHVEMT